MIELKQHNIKPYRELCDMLQKEDRVAYISATGTGKSYVAGKYIEDHDLEDSTLILVPSDAIRSSWKKILPGVDIMSYQAMLRNQPDMSQCRLVICDEMHHLGAEKWGEKYQQLEQGFPGKILGMTATPVRFLDQSRDMSDELFEGNTVEGLNLPEAIEKGVLPTFNYVTALYSIPRSRQKGGLGHLTDKLYKKLDAMENQYCFQAIMAKHMTPGVHKVAVFISSISEIEQYRKTVSELYPDALHLIAHSRMRDREIKAAIDAFESAEDTAFIYTVDLLNEGTHINGVDTVVMFRRTESPTVFLQQLGRALTANQVINRVTVFDFVANYKSIKGKRDGAGDVIDWIAGEIGDGERQIIRDDYAKMELEVLDKLEKLFSQIWTEDEDELVIRLYDGGDGLEELCRLLPQRTKNSIKKRAYELGISSVPSKRFQKYCDDIKKYYCTENGFEKILALHPESNRRAITAMANRMGLRRTVKGNTWSPEEMMIIQENAALSTEELMKLLPGRTRAAIVNMKVKNGWTQDRAHEWTQEEDEILRKCRKLKVSQIREKHLPYLSESQIRARCKKLNIPVLRIKWDPALEARFADLFIKGGADAVLSDPVFSSLKRASVYDRAQVIKNKGGLKCGN